MKKNPFRFHRWAYAALLVFVFLWILLPFWVPLVLATIFALGIEPVLKRISEVLKIKLKVTAGAYLITLFLFIFIPVTLFVTRSLQSLKTLSEKLSEKGYSSWEIFANYADIKLRWTDQLKLFEKQLNIELSPHVQAWGESILNWTSKIALKWSSQVIQAFPHFVLSFGIFLITLYLFLKHKKEIKNFLIYSGALNFPKSREILEITQNACATTLIASLTTGFIQALLVSSVALYFEAGDFWLIFLTTFFVSFIPALGAGPICFVLAIPFLIRGEYFAGSFLVGFSVFTGTIDNVIRPYLVSSGDNIHPFILFLATIGGVLTLGLPGLFIGPVVAIMTLRIAPLLL